MSKPVGILLVAGLLLLALTGCSQNLVSEIESNQLPEPVLEEAMEAQAIAGAYAFNNDGIVYLAVSTGEEQRLAQHIKFLKKGAFDSQSKTLTLYFEQYTPQTGKPGTSINSSDWYLFLRFRKTTADYFQIVINDEDKYQVTVPK